MPAEIITRLKNFKSQSFSRKAHEQAVCGEAETSEGFLGQFFGRGIFPTGRGICPQKEHKKTQETGMPDILLQDVRQIL